MKESTYVNAIKIQTDSFWGCYWHSGLIQEMLGIKNKSGNFSITTEELQANAVKVLIENDTYTLEEYNSVKEFLEEFETNYSSGSVNINYIVYGD